MQHCPLDNCHPLYYRQMVNYMKEYIHFPCCSRHWAGRKTNTDMRKIEKLKGYSVPKSD